MTIKVPAVYEKGVLKLYRELELPEHTYVQVEIEVPEHEATSKNALQRLAALATDLGVDDLAEQHDHYLCYAGSTAFRSPDN